MGLIQTTSSDFPASESSPKAKPSSNTWHSYSPSISHFSRLPFQYLTPNKTETPAFPLTESNKGFSSPHQPQPWLSSFSHCFPSTSTGFISTLFLKKKKTFCLSFILFSFSLICLYYNSGFFFCVLVGAYHIFVYFEAKVFVASDGERAPWVVRSHEKSGGRCCR